MAGAFVILFGALLMRSILTPIVNTSTIGVSESRDSSTVFFGADRDQVLSPFGCVTLRWDVENIWGVYLEDAGVIGQDSRRWCISDGGNEPTLTVIFPENIPQNYTLTIDVVLFRFDVIFGAMLIAIGSMIMFPRPRLDIYNWFKRQHGFTTMLMYIWVISIVFIFWALNGKPGADFIINLADEVQRIFSTFFTAPYRG